MTQEWRPIETAPKDGSRILVWSPAGEWAGIVIANWISTSAWPSPAVTFRGYWCVSDDSEGDHNETNPTHWMPLPDEPLTDEALMAYETGVGGTQ